MNAVILAGGFGSRLKPLTDTVPKPMLPVANAPMIDYAVSHLYSAGIKDMIFTLGYFPEQVAAWEEGYGGIKTHNIIENVPLGTAGGVREARELVDDRFIVVSGDALENIDYAAMLLSHVRSGKAATIAVTRVPDPRAFGLVEYDSFGTVTGFTEKPENADADGVVNCGVYIFDSSVLRYVPKGVKYDFARDLFPELVQMRQINAYYHDGFWSDVGSPQSYYEANFKMMRGGFFASPFNSRRTVSHKLGGDDFSLAAYSSLVAGRISHCVIGADSAVASDANICDCVVMPGVTVRGRHFGEIIGDDFTMRILALDAEKFRNSPEIYKNFS